MTMESHEALTRRYDGRPHSHRSQIVHSDRARPVPERVRPGARSIESRQAFRRNVGAAERAVSVVLGSALLLLGPGRRPLTQVASRAAGGALLLRGVTGHCPAYGALGLSSADREGVGTEAPSESTAQSEVERSITIGKSPDEVYAFWRDAERFKLIMAHFAELTPRGHRTHWRVSGLLHGTVEWETELVEDTPGKHLRWRSVEGGNLQHEGTVLFAPAPGGWGTAVTLRLRFDPTSLAVGAALKVLRFVPKTVLGQALRRCKSMMETGEIPTIEWNPAARRGGRHD